MQVYDTPEAINLFRMRDSEAHLRWKSLAEAPRSIRLFNHQTRVRTQGQQAIVLEQFEKLIGGNQ